ncbi:MAG: nucleotidyltransferase domain-containing protein [Clostridia bacterium]|nr:nucleotidyltransferase domain-containing protein [Clostridia bacterium]
MIDIKTWIKDFTEKVEQTFANRVWFIGVQGSYGRGEATETSDIDVVVIIDELQAKDLKTYSDMLDTLPNRDLICGFISGKAELLNWEASDLFQFYYDTTPIKGTLDLLLEKIDKQDVKRAIRIGACNIYHACVHNFVHEKSENILCSLYKSAVFVIQAVWFYETGKYIKSKAELQNAITPPSAVLTTAQELKNGASVNFEEMSELLLNWSATVIAGYKVT